MDRPLISYVITAYNIENFMKESIECAFNQTYEPLEIILSDDCSTDKTFSIMEKMAREYSGKHKIVLNKNSTNLGITRHMNKAYLELANGEIIIAAHGDDISLSERTTKSYEFFRDNPNITALSFSIVQINEYGKVINKNVNQSIVNEIKIYDLDNPKKNGIPNIPAPSRAFYKKVMKEFGPLQDSCPTEDELITYRSLMLGKNAFLPDVMVKYRKHKDSSSNPENFDKFPLEKIYEQQLIDMKLAVNKNILTTEKMKELDEILKLNQIRRELYRNFFRESSIRNLLKLISSNHFSIRVKLSYIKQYLIKN